MSKAKKIIILSVAAILFISIAIYFVFFAKTQNRDEQSAQQAKIEEFEDLGLTQNQASEFNVSGQATRYNPNDGSIEKYNVEEEKFEKICNIDKQANYTEISPDEKKLLYVTINEPETRFSENLYYFEISNPSKQYEIKNVFSPHFLPSGALVYQDFDNAKSSLKVTEGGTIKSIALPDGTEKIIEVINSSEVVVYDFQSDLTEGRAWLVDLAKATVKELASGQGLKIKTVLNSPYLAIQKSSESSVLTEIYDYKRKDSLRTIENISLDTIDWRDNNDYYYSINARVFKSSFVSQSDEEISQVEGPVLQLKAVSANKLFVLSLDKLDIISLRQ